MCARRDSRRASVAVMPVHEASAELTLARRMLAVAAPVGAWVLRLASRIVATGPRYGARSADRRAYSVLAERRLNRAERADRERPHSRRERPHAEVRVLASSRSRPGIRDATSIMIWLHNPPHDL